jgi:thiamine kinase-like enzyme
MTLPLYDQHGGYWGEHPEHAISDWQYEVSNDETRQGYWDWVESRLEEAAEEAEEPDARQVLGSLPWCLWVSVYLGNSGWSRWRPYSFHNSAALAHDWARTARRHNPADLFAARLTEAGPPPRIPMSHA